MKKLALIAIAFLVFSCKKESAEPFGTSTTTDIKSEATLTPEALGKELFENKGACIACHRVDAKLIGPSVQEMAKTYKEQNGNIIAFLKEEAKPIMDPAQYEVMKANLAITKAMSEEELKAIEAYVNSHLK
ncbi:c-type cytochrome [Flavobacterium succinicans]|uniref:Cytochrome c-551 n=1 Tax=Flavobacterium succinicans TaxID=29536 RepID=A0A199XR96_9FLAO|nr:c-type cytochrome [Flavobacterium succinicans]OAZ03771.1 cytochrome c-551 [Flavobacterium succinicans]